MDLTLSKKIPPYDGGVAAEALYNAGCIFEDDREGVTYEDCPMLLISGTKETEYLAYLAKLHGAGFRTEYTNRTPATLSAELDDGEVRLYVYFTRLTGEVRVIEERASVPIPSISYDCIGEPEEIYQYGLYYDPKNDHSPTTTNCGMFFIVRLADNSLFLIDGGDLKQCSEAAVAGMHDFLRRITGTEEGETIRVAGWFFTHAHDDHMAACIRLLRKYPHFLKVERVFANFTSNGTRRHDRNIHLLREAIRELCPEALPVKLHTGETFTLAGTRFDVLYTHEDAVRPDAPDRYPFRDFNCTSTVLRMRAKGGTVMWLGDTNTETEALVTHTTTPEMWKADVVQVAHHCFNYLSTLYPWIDAKYAMLPNSYYGGHTVENLPKLADVLEHLKTPECIWYEDKTTGFRFENGEYTVILEEPRCDADWDGVWYDGAMHEIGG